MTRLSSLRILDLCEFFSERGGGVRSYLERMGEAASAAGHELTVVAPGPRHETVRRCGMRLVRYRAPAMPYDASYHVPWRLDLMRAVVAREEPDVVQISSPFAPALAARFSSQKPVHVYVHHSDPIGCYVRPWLARALPNRQAQCIERAAWSWHRSISRNCDATVVSADWLATELQSVGCSRVSVVPFGINRCELGAHQFTPELRAKLMGPLAERPEAALVLITGRLAVDKRQALSIDALQLVQRTRPVALVVLGTGPERDELERRARGLGHVTFLPFTHDRRQFAQILASVDFLLHAALAETFGFVIAETLTSGTPVVVPEAGGAQAFAGRDHSETFSARAGAEEVARAVQRLLARPRHELRHAAALGAATFPSASEHFERLFAFYSELVTRKRQQSRGESRTAIRHSVPPSHTQE